MREHRKTAMIISLGLSIYLLFFSCLSLIVAKLQFPDVVLGPKNFVNMIVAIVLIVANCISYKKKMYEPIFAGATFVLTLILFVKFGSAFLSSLPVISIVVVGVVYLLLSFSGKDKKEVEPEGVIEKKTYLEKKREEIAAKPYRKVPTVPVVLLVLVFIVFIVLGFVFLENFLIFFKCAFAALVILFPLCFRYKISILAKIEEIQQIDKRLKEHLAVDEKAIEFYSACKKQAKGHSKAEFSEVLSLIGQKYGKRDIVELENFYKKGEQEFNKAQLIKKDNETKERIDKLKKESASYDSEMAQKKQVIGAKKYTCKVAEWLSAAMAVDRLSGSIDRLSNANSNYREYKGDWVIAGGMASAIGGPVLGAAAAVDVQARNAQAAENEKYMHQKAADQANCSIDMSILAQDQTAKAKKYLSLFDNVLVDLRNEKEKFKLLDISEPKYTVTKDAITKIKVEVKIKLLEEPKILSKKAILDGVLKWSLYYKDKCLGEKYYIADGYGEFNYKKAGFKDKMNCSIFFYCDEPVDLNKEDLRCVIEPETLWLIEENDKIFSINNEKIEEEMARAKKERVATLKEGILSI